MKIGIFGGTFNPIHNSHIYVACEYARQLELDRMVLVPTYIPPHKSAKGLVEADHRLEMCKIATKDIPLFHVTDYEIKQQGKSYTYRTLLHINEKYPGSDLYLIMGSDMFLTIQDWRRADELFKMATLCAAHREKGDLTAVDMHKSVLENKGARCMIIDLEAHPLSSTEVRNMIKSGEDFSNCLPAGVEEYIRQHHLYEKV